MYFRLFLKEDRRLKFLADRKIVRYSLTKSFTIKIGFMHAHIFCMHVYTLVCVCVCVPKGKPTTSHECHVTRKFPPARYIETSDKRSSQGTTQQREGHNRSGSIKRISVQRISHCMITPPGRARSSRRGLLL
ncbi:hypothetical protein PUN28_011579 [Cardiocondyla obscurior]|uniref:Uncharacterized protein n=1 Tax=Cardiocondyla obscurior TaxID=286306 RepID=A0AAW2FFZ3_9HYME